MATYQVQQSTTAYPLVFLLVQSSDHITGLTGATPTVTLSKSGAAFASPSGAVTEIGNGWYKVAGNATDSATLGPLALHATAASGDPCDELYEVVAVNPQSTAYGLVLAKGTNITGLNDIAATAIVSSGAITTSSGSVSTVSSVTTTTNLTNLPSIPANWITAAGITAASLNGKGDWLLASNYTAPPTVAAIATGVWTDTTSGDFTTLTSPGKIIFAQLGGAFTSTSSSVFSTASLANAPTGGSAPTTGQIAAAVWQDLLVGADFGTAGSIGALLKLDIDTAISTRSTYAGGAVASVTAGVTVTTNNDKAGYSLLLTQALAAARALDSIADTSLTLNDALQCAVAGTVGQKDASSGTNMTIKTASTATLLRTYTITTASAPTTVPTKIV